MSDTALATVPQPAADRGERLRDSALVVTGIVLVALNLRPAITSLGALLGDVRGGLQLSGALAGVVTTLPVLCFAAVGGLTPRLSRRFGPHRVMCGATVVLAAGLALRPFAGSAVFFVVTSALGLAGIALANVLLPPLVQRHFPRRVGFMTGLYTMLLQAGTAMGAALSVPIAQQWGGWRGGLGAWGVLAVAAVVPWFALARRGSGDSASGGRSAAVVHAGRTRLGWALALYFGCQSLGAYVAMGWLPQLYRDAGFSSRDAGLLLSVVMALGVVVSFAMPALALRFTDQRPLVAALAACYLVAYAGLAMAPRAGALLWVLLLGLGQGAFPLALALIGLRARTEAGLVALSSFVQSTGYLISAVGPLGVGLIYAATGGWAVPLALLAGVIAVKLVGGFVAARPCYVEDEQVPAAR